MTGTWLQVAQEAIKIPALIVEIYGDLARLGRSTGRQGSRNRPWARQHRALAHLLRQTSGRGCILKGNYRQRSIAKKRCRRGARTIGVPCGQVNFARTDWRTCTSLLAKVAHRHHFRGVHPWCVNIINSLVARCPAQLRDSFARTFSAYVRERRLKLVGDTTVSRAISLMLNVASKALRDTGAS